MTRGQPATPTRPDGDLFDLEEVGPQVYAAIARENWIVNGNSLVVQTAEGFVVVDTQSRTLAARALLDQLHRDVAELPVRYVINTHHHLDHAHGNRAYRDAFGAGVDVIGTAFAARALDQAGRWLTRMARGDDDPNIEADEVGGQAAYYAFVRGYFGLLRDVAGSEPPDVGGRRLAALDGVLAELAAAPPDVPNITFADRVDLAVGGRVIAVLHAPPAHTAGDAIVFLPAEGVAATGDVVHGIDPLLMEGFPDEWPDSIDRVAELPFRTIVPGHGPVERDRETLRHFRAYLIEIRDGVREAVAQGLPLEEVQARLNPSALRSLVDNDYGSTMQRNRLTLVGTVAGSLEAAVANNVAEVYRFYATRGAIIRANISKWSRRHAS